MVLIQQRRISYITDIGLKTTRFTKGSFSGSSGVHSDLVSPGSITGSKIEIWADGNGRAAILNSGIGNSGEAACVTYDELV